MTESANKDCVQRHFEELWNHGQVDKVDEFFSGEFSNFGVLRRSGHHSARHSHLAQRFSGFDFQIDLVVAEGDTVMCEVTLTGTHLGDFPLIPPLHGPTLAPNGRKFRVKHIHRFRLKEAKIVEHLAVRDDLGMFQQLRHLHALSQ